MFFGFASDMSIQDQKDNKKATQL